MADTAPILHETNNSFVGVSDSDSIQKLSPTNFRKVNFSKDRTFVNTRENQNRENLEPVLASGLPHLRSGGFSAINQSQDY